MAAIISNSGFGFYEKMPHGVRTSVKGECPPLSRPYRNWSDTPSSQFALQFEVALSGCPSVTGVHQPDGFRYGEAQRWEPAEPRRNRGIPVRLSGLELRSRSRQILCSSARDRPRPYPFGLSTGRPAARDRLEGYERCANSFRSIFVAGWPSESPKGNPELVRERTGVAARCVHAEEAAG